MGSAQKTWSETLTLKETKKEAEKTVNNDYLDVNLEHIKKLAMDIRWSKGNFHRVKTELDALNEKCQTTNTKALIFVRTSHALLDISNPNNSRYVYRIKELPLNETRIPSWQNDKRNHILATTFSLEDQVLRLSKTINIGTIVHVGSCGSMRLFLKHCLFTTSISAVLSGPSTMAESFRTEDELSLHGLFASKYCQKIPLYRAMGMDGISCREEGCVRCPSCADASGYRHLRRTLRLLAERNACGYCALHKSRVLDHALDPENSCIALEKTERVGHMVAVLKRELASTTGLCRTCALPVRWCPGPECTYKGIPIVICCSAVLDREISVHYMGLDEAENKVEYLLNEIPQSGMLFVLKSLADKGFLQLKLD